MDKKEFALKQHEAWAGKIEVVSRAKVETPEELSVAYTPGVAEPCLEIFLLTSSTALCNAAVSSLLPSPLAPKSLTLGRFAA